MVHGEFKRELERCLRCGEETGDPFSQIIKAMSPKPLKRADKEPSQGAQGRVLPVPYI